MASYTAREPQEYLWLPFGTYRGKPFPEVPRVFLERVMTKWNADPMDEQYPGLLDSISDYLNGGGYYHGQDTEEKRKAREEAEKRHNPWSSGWAHFTPEDPHKSKQWDGAGTYSVNDPHENKASDSSWFEDMFNEARSWNQKYGQQERQQGRYDPPPPRRKDGINKEMAKQIIAAGRRALAAKHHPDKGGDVETMQDVNAAADWLETLL